jgi:hypothetical protein
MRQAKGLIEKANRARDASEWVQAAHYYREGLSLIPDNAAVWVQYGHALKGQAILEKLQCVGGLEIRVSDARFDFQ